jgi:hypothetical protein
MQLQIIMINFRKTTKRIIPVWSYKFIKCIIYTNYFNLYLILTSGIRHHLAFRKIIGKSKINIVFFAIDRTTWKYDQLYKLFEQNERFEPAIVVCAYSNVGNDIMAEEMTKTYSSLTSKKFNVFKTYNVQTGEWLDVKKVLRPDIIFFTNPHKLTKEDYSITNYTNYLTCYLPYTFQISHLYELQYNQLFHNLIWKIFYPTTIHREIAQKNARNGGKNAVVSGYIGTDILQDNSYIPIDLWKIKNRNIKRIIWAPHHSIDNDTCFLAYSNFIRFHNIMLEIAMSHFDKIQIAFKPHPILKTKLYLEKDWGFEKTNAYYSSWENLPNGQLEESDYADLFLTSDAMVHDSASFMAEYMAVNKPVLYTIRDHNVTDRFNLIGKMAFEQHYHAYSSIDIINFIEDVVINENDIKKSQRESFILKYLKPPNNVSATLNIYKMINDKFKVLGI